MKYTKSVLMYLVAFFLQPVLYNLIPIFGGHLNLILVLTVVLTFVYDEPFPALLFGTLFSLLYDAFYGLYMGAGTLALVAVAAVILLLRPLANIENFVNMVIAMLCSTWIYASVYWLIYDYLGSAYSYLYCMRSLPWQLLFNSLIALILYLIFIKGVKKHRKDRYYR